MGDLPRKFGPYVLLKVLGQGTMGEVYLARPQTAREGVPEALVIKCLRTDAENFNENWVRRFSHEAQIAARIESPHVAHLFDAGTIDDQLYLAIEYIAGWPLSRVIQEMTSAGRELPFEAVAELMEGALLGAQALHDAKDESGRSLGIVHRDIAPKNIMVGEDGRVVLIDLGVGNSNLKEWRTRTGAVVGTVMYMPPEQLCGEKVDRRADVYALGAVFYELLTRRPYIDEGPLRDVLAKILSPVRIPPSRHRSDVGPELDRLVLKALAPDALERFESAAELLSAMRRVIPRHRGPPLTALLGQMFADEVAEARTEIKGLAELAFDTIDEGATTMVVMARAPNVALDPLAVVDPTYVPTAVVRRRSPPRSATRKPTTALRAVRALAIMAAVMSLVLLGVVLGRTTWEKEAAIVGDPPALTAQVVPRSAAVEPAADLAEDLAADPAMDPAEVPHRASPPEKDRSKATSKRILPATPRPKVQGHAEVAEPQAEAPAPKAEPSVEEDLAHVHQLIDRAKRLAEATGGEKRQRLFRIVSQLIYLKASKNFDVERRVQIPAIEKELSAL